MMRIRRIFVFVCVAAVIAVRPQGALATLDCETRLRAIAGDARLLGDGYVTADQPSVSFVGSREGVHGGRQLTIQRQDNRLWGSTYTEYILAKQGDPRSFAQIFDETTAKFFGFEVVSENRIRVPDAKEFIGALEKVKAVLSRHAKRGDFDEAFVPTIGFYEQPASDRSDWDRFYVKKFANELKLPLSTEIQFDRGGVNSLVHDISYHAPTGILLHPSALSLAANQTSAILKADEVYNELASETSISADRQKLEAIGRLLLLLRLEHIDTGTANLSHNLAVYLRTRDLKEWNKQLMSVYKSLVSQRVAWTKSSLDLNLDLSRYQGLGFVSLSSFLLGRRMINSPEEMNYAKQFVDIEGLGIRSADIWPWSEAVERRLKEVIASKESDSRMSRFIFARHENDDQEALQKDVARMCDYTVLMRNAIVGAVHEIRTGTFPQEYMPTDCPLPLVPH